MLKIAFLTLGCKVNQSDTASMELLFRQAGHDIVPLRNPTRTCILSIRAS